MAQFYSLFDGKKEIMVNLDSVNEIRSITRENLVGRKEAAWDFYSKNGELLGTSYREPAITMQIIAAEPGTRVLTVWNEELLAEREPWYYDEIVLAWSLDAHGCLVPMTYEGRKEESIILFPDGRVDELYVQSWDNIAAYKEHLLKELKGKSDA